MEEPVSLCPQATGTSEAQRRAQGEEEKCPSKWAKGGLQGAEEGRGVLSFTVLQASRKAGTRGKFAAIKQAQRSSSNIFSMFEQAQIQEFKEAFSCIDQNRDGIICKSDLRETYSQLGKVSIPEEELDAMLQEGKGPINFTVFLTLFGEKLNGTDPEEAILSAFRMFDPSGQGVVNKDEFKQLLLTQADKFSLAEVEQMFALTPMDLAGNIDYKSLCYVITHGDEKEE
ncbi:PREDICTED: myosin regulatory light chain 2, atrial isoform [Elephantulus edwardii]|uniref:myosin regulatory light chain 2, atrial isoform n=1 Tax=Elephantulus edwardii TaxID=28737 RepID=UPI0003F09E2D|nr:PREDICTED: myosin regulatory light chain 2, atrial isoform [Elephantulus edwardii]